MSDILNDAITIESVEQKDNRITLLAHNKNRYAFWTTRKVKDENDNPIIGPDGQPVLEDSAPYAQFKNMGLRKGSTVRIGYVIEEYEYTNKKTGLKTKGLSNKIINFQETNEQPTQPSQTIEKPQAEANRGQSGASSDRGSDAFGRRLAIQGHINALLSNPSYYVPGGDEGTPGIQALVREAIAIEDEAEKQINPSALRQAVARHAPRVVEEDLPVIQQEEGFSDEAVEDIPF